MFKTTWRLFKSIFGCALGAIIATACMFASIYVRKSFAAEGFLHPEAYAYDSQWFAVTIAASVFAALVILGLPVQAAFQKERITAYVWHALPATILGAIIFAGLMSLTNNYQVTIDPNDIIRGALLGLISGSIAWLVRRPDKDPEILGLPKKATKTKRAKTTSAAPGLSRHA